ncbi:FAD-dependent oxidoreductase [Paenibacillus sp. IB182496]|uniref:FAD-dependent oxidoreductase n=1 Tax=Paenibacillus sabuli TaxID=2772509 RepID=A0A927GPZ0_9BACL|nr:FAD-dependent oxidoreductase [Paenibacillus sabuli]MBD2843974.1 FAD-dependent oxidoreductase [Paenibacillus sabuli]
MQHKEERDYDLVVAGGGLAGICCAIAAARRGARTAIIQDRAVFGGNSSSEIRIVPIGSALYSSWMMETGLIAEMLLEDRATNHETFKDGAINTLYDLNLLHFLTREPSLDVYANTRIYEVECDEQTGTGERRIAALSGLQSGSGKQYRFRAQQFADCTGDGVLAQLAGAAWKYGRDGRDDYQESLAPVLADAMTMGSSITFYAKNTGAEQPFTAPAWAKRIDSQEEVGVLRSCGSIGQERFSGFWWLELSNPFHVIDDFEQIKHELTRFVLGYWDYLKNRSVHKEALRTFAIDWIGSYPGKRESRRVVGDVVLSERHVLKDARWPDRIGCSGMFIDLHINGGILNKLEPPELSNLDSHYKNYTMIAPYSVPLRAMYSKDIANLWLGGRNISVSRVALGAIRNQCILASLGQAVGTGAAYALQHRLAPRQLAEPGSDHLSRLQQQLLQDDVHILGLARTGSLTSGCRARASSERPLDLDRPAAEERWVCLDQEWGQVFPVTQSSVERLAFFVANSGDQEETVTVRLARLERIWDQDHGELAIQTQIVIPARYEGWVQADVQREVAAGYPYRVSLGGTAHVRWRHAQEQAVGTLSQYRAFHPAGGPEARNRSLPSLQPEELVIPPMDKWVEPKRTRHSLCMHVTPQSTPYGAGNVISGAVRPYALPNVWMSDPTAAMPQFVELLFPERTQLNEVTIYFDVDLNTEYAVRPGRHKSPECVKAWRLLCREAEADEWTLLHEEYANYQRLRKVRTQTVTATALRLEVLETNGAAYASVYGIEAFLRS